MRRALDPTELREGIRCCIVDILEQPARIHDDTPLLSSGLMDSVGVEQLMLWLEEEVQVVFSDEDYSIENFDTVGSIEALVSRRLRSETA